MTDYPPVEGMMRALNRAGWSIGDVAIRTKSGPGWVVFGTNGENQVLAHGRTTAEAWWLACEQARACGMLGCR